MECPFIDKDIKLYPSFNKEIQFENKDGSIYIFYNHFDGFDQYYNYQFCKLIGHTRDVFKCLNESEWHECSHYQSNKNRLIKC